MSVSRLLFLAAIAAVCALFLRLWVLEGIYIASGSMEPTLKVGTHVVLDKVTFRFRDPRRGEVVLLREPVPPHTEMVKRVIGVAGDVVELRAKRVFLGGSAADDSFATHSRREEKLKGDDLGPFTVPPLHFFVLGDNRDESNDSSVWKDPDSGEPEPFVPRSGIRGKVRGFY
jgi:signal peptidase I